VALDELLAAVVLTTDNTDKRTLIVVGIGVLLGRNEIGSEPVRDERYPLCGFPDRNNGSNG
jgi:hypothetical protein